MTRFWIVAHKLLSRALLPPGFRAEYGDELGAALRARVESKRGVVGVSALGMLELLDLVRTASREWWATVTYWSAGWTRGLSLDLRVAMRSLAKSPGFTAAAVLTLTIGIGASAAIYSVVDAVLLRPLPYPEADRIVRLAIGGGPQGPWLEGPFSDRGYRHFVDENDAYQTVGAYQTFPLPLVGDGPPVEVEVASMTRSAFEVLALTPELGRLPTAGEDSPGSLHLVALISHRLWAERYRYDLGAIGRRIELGGLQFELIGVMPEGYAFPTTLTDVWIPSRLDPASANFGLHNLEVVARLLPNMTIEEARKDGARLIARFDEVGYGPEWLAGILSGEAVVRLLKDDVVGRARQPLLIVVGTVGLLLLVGCSNVATLLLVRRDARVRGRAIRVALGARWGHLTRSVLMESLILSLAGGVAGVGLATFGTGILAGFGPPSIPRLESVRVDGGVLLVTLALSLAVGLLTGLIPALERDPKAAPLVAPGRRLRGTMWRGGRSVSSLVVAQVAVSVVLLTACGLLVRSFRALHAVDPGFETENALTFRVSLGPADYRSAEGKTQFFERLMHGLEGAFLVQYLPETLEANSPAFTQYAVDSMMPGVGKPFVAVALFFFAFTTLLAYYYIAETNVAYLKRTVRVPGMMMALKIVLMASVFYGAVRTANLAWGLGDMGVGLMAWLNIIAILIIFAMANPAMKALRDYEDQRRRGVTRYTFDPEALGIRNAHFWTKKD
jgi:hypothetical protein